MERSLSLRCVVLGASVLLAFACTRASDPLGEIRRLHDERRYAETVDRLREIVDEDPSQAEANLLLGTALLRTGNAGLAVWPLRRATESPDLAVDAGMLLTEAMLESRTAPDAVEEIDRVLALQPQNVDALVLRVEAYQETNRLEDALADIDRVLELDPDNLAVLVPRVTALIALNRIEEAGTALDAASERVRNAAEDLSPALTARLCVARALFSFEKGETEVAEERYADCLEQSPSNVLTVTEAVGFFDSVGQPERATGILERALEESGAGTFRVMLARRKGALGDEDAEERLLREEAEARPTAMSWFVVADYYVQRDRLDEALAAFEEALAVGPATPRLRFAYADTLVRAKRYERARRVASRLEHAELRDLIHGRILLAQHRPRAALEAFEAGIRLWPNNPGARFLAGQASERIGDFGRATSHYRESFRTNPGDSEAGLALAELYAAQGELDGALQIAGRYLRTHPGDVDAFLASVDIAHAAGRRDIVTEGLERLARLPGQAATAKAREASLLAASEGPERAIAAVEDSDLDLTDPANAIALRALLEQLARMDRHEKAARLLDAAIAAHPEASVFHELRGRALHAAGKSREARDAYARALELDPRDADALAGLAALEAEAGDRAAALALYDRADEADPEDPAPALAAISLVRESDPDEAARRLAALLDAHPREAAAAVELARLLADRGDLDRAAAYAARAAWFRFPEAEATLARIRELREQTAAAADAGT